MEIFTLHLILPGFSLHFISLLALGAYFQFSPSLRQVCHSSTTNNSIYFFFQAIMAYAEQAALKRYQKSDPTEIGKVGFSFQSFSIYWCQFFQLEQKMDLYSQDFYFFLFDGGAFCRWNIVLLPSRRMDHCH
jgi:hypothetical protein